MKKTVDNNIKKGEARRLLERVALTVLALICCGIGVLCGSCADNTPYSTEITVSVEQLPAPLAAISSAIDSYRLEWRDGTGARRTIYTQSIDRLPNIDIALYKPSVITLTPIHSTGYHFPPAGTYLNHPSQLHTAIELSWSYGCAIAYLQELSFRLVDFERFNGERFLYEVDARSDGRSCLIESETVIAKVATYAMRATYITLQKHHTHLVAIPSGTWYFLDWSLPPLTIAHPLNEVTITLPAGTYVLTQTTGAQRMLTITAVAAYVY